jgi:hypothetical protein
MNMDDMVAQGFGAIVIIYGGLIVITLGIVLFITKFWDALVSGDTGFILLWCAVILVLVSLYAGGGLLLRKYDII